MAPNPKDQLWYSLAEQASQEPDPIKLLELIGQLCAALDARPTAHAARPTAHNEKQA